MPFTPLGRKTWLATASVGSDRGEPRAHERSVKGGVTGTAVIPWASRLALWNLRTIRVLQSPENVVVLICSTNKWRVIRTTHRAPGEFDEPRVAWISVGRWVMTTPSSPSLWIR